MTKIPKKVSNRISRKMSRKVSKKVSRKSPRKVSKKVSRKVSRKSPRKVSRKLSRKVTRKVSRKVSRKSSKKLSRKSPRKVSKKVSRKSPRKVSKKVSRKVSKKVSRKVSKKVSRKVSKKVSRKSPRKISKKVSRKSPRKVLKKVYKKPAKLAPKKVFLTYYEIEQPLRSLKYIKGPITLTEHKHPKYGKHIYIFGDIHIQNTFCPGDMTIKNSEFFNIFLKQLLNYWNEEDPKMMLDYFIEFGFRNLKTPKDLLGLYYGGYYQDLYNRFLKCVEIKKEVCDFKNLRLHYADVRRGFEETEILNTLEKYRHNRKYKVDWKKLKYMLENPEIYLRINKVDKQIEAIDLPEVKKLLNGERNTLIIKSKMFAKKIDEIKLYPWNSVQLWEAEMDLLELRSTIMDLYLFARMFRRFQESYKGQYSKPANKIVVYVGDAHALVYRQWLSRLGFSIKGTSSETQNKDFQCIDVSYFKQPFFS